LPGVARDKRRDATTEMTQPGTTDDPSAGAARAGRFRARLRPTHVRIAAVVGLCYYVASFVIFRDVLVAIPSVLRGDSVIVGDELVPFFNPGSQLIDQARGEFSELTNGFEFRVRYSFLTTWVRHYQVLPFAILLFLPTIVWAAYLTTAWFVSEVFRTLEKTTVYVAAAFPTALFYMIMIYAKITHFYTLVFGLMLMTISIVVMLDALIFRTERWGRRMVAACAVTLLNPAVHYLVLFALFMTLTVTALVLGEFARWIRRGGPGRAVRWRPGAAWRRLRRPAPSERPGVRLRTFLNGTTGRSAVAMVTFACVAVVPYALFVKFVALRGVENLSETVPGDYYFIRDASVSLVHLLSWDLAGIMDKIQFGDYLAKVPRVSNMIYTIVLLVPFAVPWVRRSLFPTRRHRQLLGVILVNVGFAAWATVGYAEPGWLPTFHRSLAATTRAAYATESIFGNLTLAVSSTIVQVLRFPHRFQLILFALAPALMTLSLAWGIDRLMGRRSTRSARQPRSGRVDVVALAATGIALGTIFFGPFLANEPYRKVYGSGDFNGFAAAYPVDELAEVKEALEELPQGKTVVLPPTETAKLVVGSDGVAHKFIDKFYIYYLDQPSFYYGLTGDSVNKFEFFLLLRSLYYQQDWWVNVARDIGLEYIVLNKQVEDNRGVGAEYLPDIETYLREQIEAVPEHVEQLYENDSFVLYRLDDTAPAGREVLLFDTSWQDYLDAVFTRLDLSRCYDFRYISDYDGVTDEQTTLLATDERSAALDIWARAHQTEFFVPSSKIFAFNPDVVASSYYLSPMFRLFLFFSDTKWNRTEMITPGIFGTLDGSFIGVPRATRFTVPATVTTPGRYRVLMRAAATANDLDVSSPTLGFSTSAELRSPGDALQFFHVDEIYEPDRVATDTAAMSVEELEQTVPSELVPINLRYVYHDLGTVDAAAGAHTFVVDKQDDNPMLVEGVLLVPEDTYATISVPDDVTIADGPSDLRCSEQSEVRAGVLDGTLDGVGNGPHADLTAEELIDLIGVDLETPDPDGLGGRWQHVIVTILILVACLGVIRWRATRVWDDDPEGAADHEGER
jgi:hypothetical protein